MYRHQLPTSKDQQYHKEVAHIRKSDRTLFEDSPDTNLSYPQSLQYQEPQIYQRITSAEKTPPAHYFQQNLHQRHYQNQPPLNNNYIAPTQQLQPQVILPQQLNARFSQSEESGGSCVKNDSMTLGEEGKEGENDIEYIIMNLYSKMKNLENKYIDLANFYKQELVRGQSVIEEQPPTGYARAFSSSGPYERPDIDQSLEEDMKQMIALRGMQHQSPQLNNNKKSVSEFKIQNELNSQAIKGEVSDSFKYICSMIDKLQKSELNLITQKQNDMYQLAQRYNMGSTIKNEALALWYDVKTKVSECMGELKQSVQSQNKKLLKKISKTQDQTQSNLAQPDSLQAQLEQLNLSDGNILSTKALDDFKKELHSIKKKQEIFQKNVQKLKHSLKFKESYLKEDQVKIQMIIKDLKQSVSLSDENKRLMSGDKQSSIMMSPFEKRIATYQKSAELRKQSEVRSGSRGPRPQQMAHTASSFYQRDQQNHQILSVQSDDQDLRLIKSKVKNLDSVYEDLQGKMIMRNQDVSDLERTVDSSISDIHKFLISMENIIQQKKPEIKPKNKQRETSPYGQGAYYSNSNQPGQDKKVSELQRSNDQIYQDLRKANEKYLNQRVENSKLKDEIQVITNQLEEANNQLRRLNSNKNISSNEASTSNMNVNPPPKQQIRQKTRASRHEGQTQLNTSGARQSSNTSAHANLERENEELKQQVRDLEKECYQMTYYQQEIQKKGHANDPYVRKLNQENQDQKIRVEQLCLNIQKFFLSMKRLQRAVSSKDKDNMQAFKSEFEKNKKNLELLVKEIKDKEEQKQNPQLYTSAQIINNVQSSFMGVAQSPTQTHQSMIMGSQDRRESNQRQQVPQQRNRSQAPIAQQLQVQSRSAIQFPATQRPPTVPDETGNSSKRGGIRPKHPQVTSPSNNRYQDNSEMNSMSEIPQNQLSYADQEQFNKLIEEIKGFQEEGERMKKQLDKLQSLNDNIMAEKNVLDLKNQQLNSDSQRTTNQIRSLQDKINRQEQLLNEYKEGVYILENQKGLSNNNVSQQKQKLLMKERELMDARSDRSQDSSYKLVFPKQPAHTQTEEQENLQQVIDELSNQNQQLQEQFIDQIQNLSVSLTQQIQEKQSELDYNFLDLEQRLVSKEEEVQRLKELWVEKLRELESSFQELSQDMIDTEQVQEEATKKINVQKKKQMKDSIAREELERSIEEALGGKDNDEDELEQLTLLNEQLQMENNELRQQIKQMAQQQQHQQQFDSLLDQLDSLKESNEQYELQIHTIENEQRQSKSIQQQQKQQLDKAKKELTEEKQNKEKAFQEYQKELNDLELELQQQSVQNQNDQNKFIQCESDLKNAQKSVKQFQQDNQQLKTENQNLKNAEEALKQQIQLLKQEQEYLGNLKQGQNEEAEEQNISVNDEDRADQQNIANNPIEAANQYLRLLKVTKKEFKILQNSNNKLQQQYDDLKEKTNDLKKESRENLQDIMDMEAKISDLVQQNQKMAAELDKKSGSLKADEDTIRKEIEEQFRERMAFKDSEVDSMTQRLARVSQNNIDLTNKSQRLEQSNHEINTELEQLRNKYEPMEMELELTKQNHERDMERMEEMQREKDNEALELQKQHVQKIHEEKLKIQSDLKLKVEELQQLQEEQNILESSHNEQKIAINNLKSHIDLKDQELEKQKLIHEKTEQKRVVQIQQQNEEKKRLLDVQKKENEDLLKKHQESILKEQDKQGALEKEKQAMEAKHVEEVKKLADKLRIEREQQESRLIEGEKEKLERIRNEMEVEKQQALLELREEEATKKKLELQQLTNQLTHQHTQTITQKDKQAMLVFKLQAHYRKILETQIQSSLQQVNELQNEIQNERTIQKQALEKKQKELILIHKLQVHALKIMERNFEESQQSVWQKQDEVQELQFQIKEEKEEAKVVIEEERKEVKKLLQESQNAQKLKNKQNSLLLALQKFARESLLKLIDQEKVQREVDKEEFKRKESILIQDNQTALQQAEQKKQKDIESLAQKHLQEKQQVEQQLNQVISEAKEKSNETFTRQQSEIERLKKDQDDLVKSLSQQQDQQTKDLLQQKEREKEQLQIEAERQAQELKQDHEKELQEKEKQTKLLVSMQEKLRMDLEHQLQQQIKENQDKLELLHTQKEQESEKSKQNSELKLKEIQGQEEKLRNQIEEQRVLSEKLLHEQIDSKDSTINDLNNQLTSIQQQLNQLQNDHRVSIEQLTHTHLSQIQDLNKQQQNELSQSQKQRENIEKQLNQQIQQLKESHSNELGQLQEQFNGIHKEELNSLKALYEKQIASTKEQNEKVINERDQQINHLNSILQKKDEQIQTLKQSLDELKLQHTNELEQKVQQNEQELQSLQGKLTQDHQKQSEKMKSLQDKMAQKIREELQQQITLKQQENESHQLRISDIEVQLQEKDLALEEAHQTISDLQKLLKSEQDKNEQLNKQVQKFIGELDSLKKSQLESENGQIRELREKVISLEAIKKSQEDIMRDKETEQDRLNKTISAKNNEIENLEKDLEQQIEEFENEKQELQKQNEAQIQQLQNDNEQIQQQIILKNQTISLLEKQIQITEQNQKDIDLQVEKEMQELREEKEELYYQIEQLKQDLSQAEAKVEQSKQKESKDDFNKSIDEIETKLGEFDVELSKVKQQNKELQKQRQLSDSLLDNVQQDKLDEVIGEIGSSTLQYCKRVKFLEKAWILVQQANNYFWIDQEKIPFEKFQRIKVQDIEENNDNLQQKLSELTKEKNNLLKIVKQRGGNVGEVSILSQTMRKTIENENAEMKEEQQELKIQVNNLQSANLQLKAKISELNDMIYGLADTDKNHEIIQKIVKLNKDNEETTSKLLKQYEINHSLETELEERRSEIEILKKQQAEGDYSFARGARGGNSILRPEQFDLNTSSIEKPSEFEELNQALDERAAHIKSLEEELKKYKQQAAKLEQQKDSLLSEVKEARESSSATQIEERAMAEVKDQMKQLRQLFRQYIEKTPFTQYIFIYFYRDKTNEAMLFPLFSMMEFQKTEIEQIKEKRDKVTNDKVNVDAKKGIAGFFGKKK